MSRQGLDAGLQKQTNNADGKTRQDWRAVTHKRRNWWTNCQNHCPGAVFCVNTPALLIFYVQLDTTPAQSLTPAMNTPHWCPTQGQIRLRSFAQAQGGPIARGRCKKKPKRPAWLQVSQSVPLWKSSQRVVQIIYENSNNSKQLCPSHNNWTFAWGSFSVFFLRSTQKRKNAKWRRFFFPNCAANV